MESLNELFLLVSVILGDGFDFQAFLGWEGAFCLTFLSLVGGFHYYTLNFGHMGEPNQRVPLAAQGIIFASQELLLSRATAVKANRVPAGIGPTSILPRDLTARRNF
ncbi:MAG: hypothetical protein ACLQPD_36350 [Desulfomonilaceae bacterium]